MINKNIYINPYNNIIINHLLYPLTILIYPLILYIYIYIVSYIHMVLRGWHTTPASLCIEIANNRSTQN